MSRVRWFLFCVTVSLVASGTLRAQDSISLVRCDGLLGANYDSLPPSARQARLVQFDNCWRRLSTNAINRGYADVIRQVNIYKAAARQTVFGDIQGKADTETQLLQTEQRAELSALDQEYEQEARAIQLATTPENRAEMRASAQELLLETRKATAELQAKHQQDNSALQQKIRTAYITADDQIDRLVDADLVSLGQQQADKLAYVGDMFDRFVSATAESASDEQPVFGWLEGLFRYTSGLVGRRDPPEVTIDTQYGTLGIRG